VIHARPIVSALLKGRVTFTPMETAKRWTLRGEGSIVGLFERAILPLGVASPAGFWCSNRPVSGDYSAT
jgi:hypothetical protein